MTRTALLAATAIVALTAGAASGAALHPDAATHGLKVQRHTPNTVTTWPGHVSGASLIWNQIGAGVACPKGGVSAYVSDNFTSGHFPTYSNAMADDFSYPVKSANNGVVEVDACGSYAGWPGPVNTITITFYKNSDKGTFSHPKKPVKNGTVTLPVIPQNVVTPGTCAPSDSQVTTTSGYKYRTYGHFACYLKNPVKLKAGQDKEYFVSVVANMQFINSSGVIQNGEWYWDITPLTFEDQAVWQNPGNGFATGCTTWGTLSGCLGAPSSDLMFALWG